MSKKTFTGGLNSLLGESKPKDLAEKRKAISGKFKKLNRVLEQELKIGRPKTQFKEITKSSQEGTKENETRATFIVNEELLEKVKAIAYWDRVLFKDVINSALEDAVGKYEKKNGKVKPVKK